MKLRTNNCKVRLVSRMNSRARYAEIDESFYSFHLIKFNFFIFLQYILYNYIISLTLIYKQNYTSPWRVPSECDEFSPFEIF